MPNQKLTLTTFFCESFAILVSWVLLLSVTAVDRVFLLDLVVFFLEYFLLLVMLNDKIIHSRFGMKQKILTTEINQLTMIHCYLSSYSLKCRIFSRIQRYLIDQPQDKIAVLTQIVFRSSDLNVEETTGIYWTMDRKHKGMSSTLLSNKNSTFQKVVNVIE